MMGSIERAETRSQGAYRISVARSGARVGSQEPEMAHERTIDNSKRLVKVLTLLGSLINTYFPSGIFMQRSVTVRTIPQPFASETLSWLVKSVGRMDAVLKMTWRVLSRGFARET